eukprot:gb/GFBE01073073.1/.p1 GENE.gb/GFBE01073073.1/~~gb/GFBE01073073.1/.p1  ORF type:complete len:403 (+),score=92.24 gb/GFBE01073073.1/:1-1209(+)
MEAEYGRYFLSDCREALLDTELPSPPQPNREAQRLVARAVAEEVVEEVLNSVHEESKPGAATSVLEDVEVVEEVLNSVHEEPTPGDASGVLDVDAVCQEVPKVESSPSSSNQRKVLRWSEHDELVSPEDSVPPPRQAICLEDERAHVEAFQAQIPEAEFVDDDRPPARSVPPSAPLQTMPPPPTPASSPPGAGQGPQRSAAPKAETLGELGSMPDPAPTLSLLEMDQQLSSSLDAFFGDDSVWQTLKKDNKFVVSEQLAPAIEQLEVVSKPLGYMVTVPRPYPGVQYRRSKNLEDRYSRFAENGAVVYGQVEPDGKWLRISGNVYLPVRVGTIDILEELPREPEPQDQAGATNAASPNKLPEGWWVCCPSSASKKAAEAQAQGGTALQQAAKPMRPATGSAK